MQVRVLFFGVLKDLLSSNGDAVTLPEGATVAHLLEQLRNGGTHSVWSSLAVAVNREYAAASAGLHEGDEGALLAPVSGAAKERMAPVAARVPEPIDRDALVASLKQPADGA